MSIGKVTVWYMSESERLAYIEKYPIIPTGETNFSSESVNHKLAAERRKEALEGNRIIDGVDKDLLHKMYMDGVTLPKMADELNINRSTLNNYLIKQRKINPDKWPIRSLKKNKTHRPG
jgi:DNA invertase Pin-like site-specific DNA recombinase